MTDEQIAEEYDLLLSKETDASERTFDSVEPTWNDKVLAALAAARADEHARCVRLIDQRYAYDHRLGGGAIHKAIAAWLESHKP